MFCTYLTMYTGNKLPKWYIGSTSVEKIINGYLGSVVSRKYKDIWNFEIKNNLELFKVRILSVHSNRIKALEEELRLHNKHTVHTNPKYINMSLASVNGFFGVSVSGPAHPSYGKVVSNETIIKHKNTMNTPNADGITPRDIVAVKVKATLSSQEWKEKYGNAQVAKRKIIGEDGLNYYQKMSKKGLAVLSSDEWKNTKGVESIKKQTITRNRIEENGKSFQYNVAQKGSKTKIINSPHYNVYNNYDVMIEQNVSRKFVRENYTDRLRSRTKENPIIATNSKFKGYYCEVIS